MSTITNVSTTQRAAILAELEALRKCDYQFLIERLDDFFFAVLPTDDFDDKTRRVDMTNAYLDIKSFLVALQKIETQVLE